MQGSRVRDLQLPPEVGVLAEAAFELAVMSLTGLAGQVLPRNETQGVHLLQQAAKAGSVEALLALSNRYLTGSGLPKDCDAAVRFASEPQTILQFTMRASRLQRGRLRFRFRSSTAGRDLMTIR